MATSTPHGASGGAPAGAPGAPPQGGLDGIRVLDLATLFPAPLLAAMLGDFGADVVKVEPPGGDALRHVGTPGADGISSAWALAGRNKRSIALDPEDPSDLDTLAALSAVADVVIVNQPHRILSAWNCTPEAITRRNPRAVVVALTTYGTSGPLADVGGNGSIAEAFAGFAALNGDRLGPPTLPSLALGDTLGAISALNGVLAALYWRDCQGGTGQFIDATLYEPVLQLQASAYAAWDTSDPPPRRNGSRLANAAPRNVYECRDGTWIAVSATTDPQVARMLALLDPVDQPVRFRTAAQRVGAVADELDGLVAHWVGSHDRPDALAALEAARLPAAPVQDLADVLVHPHVQARASLAALDALRTVPAPAPRLSATPARVHRPAPELGADTNSIRSTWLEP